MMIINISLYCGVSMKYALLLPVSNYLIIKSWL